MNKTLIVPAIAVLLTTGCGSVHDRLLEMHGGGPKHAAVTHTAEAEEGPAWPKTKVGALARGWVEAFSAGEEPMRAFLSKNMAAESLKERSLEERMASYRSLRQHFGTLKLGAITSQADGELQTELVPSDGSKVTFTFTAQTKAPFALLAVKMQNPHST